MTNTFRIAFVCLGNICRSPMAHVVMERHLEKSGINDVEIVSAGTGDWNVGNPIDRRAGAVLTTKGYESAAHIAEQFTRDWYADTDLILAMDAMNYADICELAPTVADQHKVRMFREFDPLAENDLEVPDPYYGADDGFDRVMSMIERTVDNLIAQLPALRAEH